LSPCLKKGGEKMKYNYTQSRELLDEELELVSFERMADMLKTYEKYDKYSIEALADYKEADPWERDIIERALTVQHPDYDTVRFISWNPRLHHAVESIGAIQL
tara:strand:+ start:1282 stop:1590 length:309 start_codon:yes stop_codon:yes gene_type:complete